MFGHKARAKPCQDQKHKGRAVEGGEGAEAPHIDVPQVARRFAASDPLGHQAAGTARVGDARRVESGTHVVAGDLRRLAEDEVAVRREALRPVEQHLDLGCLQAGRAVDGVLHQGLELVPVLAQQLKLKVRWNRVHAPGLGHRLKAAHQQAAHLFLVVDVPVRIAQNRQVGRHARDLLGDDVEVLG